MRNHTWVFVYSEANSLLANDIFFSGFTNYPKIPGIFRTIIYVNRGGVHICRVPKAELERVHRQGTKFFSATYRKIFLRSTNACAQAFDTFYQTLQTADVTQLSNQQLLRLFNQYVRHLSLMFAYYQVSGGRCFPIIEEYVRQRMARYLPNAKLDASYGLALSSPAIDIIEREAVDLRRLAQQRKVSHAELHTHAKQYALLFINSYNERKIVDRLRQRIKVAKREKVSVQAYEQGLRAEKKSLARRQAILMRTLRDEPALVQLIEFLREQGKIRFEYKNWKNGAEYKFLELFSIIAQRLKLPLREYLMSYRVADTRAFLSTGKRVPRAERQARQHVSVFLRDHRGKRFASGNKAEQLASKMLKVGRTATTVLRGSTAHPGKVTARARVILPSDWQGVQQAIRKFKAGEVLVTTMTEPNLIFIMKKAAAIVTNQGGMTSHAAVISRELGIPCVVGTYEATDVLKTGELVEVDATNGTVRKI